jgi:glycine/D-amino acid oxidase-like deaminating enzyme
MPAKSFDMIVIGAGPGGYVAAIRGAQLGLNVAIVEREHLGGICLNWGCIPTKALLRSAEVFHLMHRAKEFGLKAEGISYDLDAVVARSRGVAKQLSGGIGHLMKKNKITVFMGAATIPAKGKVTVKTDKGTEELESKAIILATGARGARAAGAGSGRRSGLDLQARAATQADAEKAAGHRIGRHRHRICQLLQHAGRRHDSGRGDGPRAARGRRRSVGLREKGFREAGDEDPRKDHRQEARPQPPARSWPIWKTPRAPRRRNSTP